MRQLKIINYLSNPLQTAVSLALGFQRLNHSNIVTPQDRFPLYAENFSNWSYQASAILQFMIWTSLADNSIGANLQHYNPVIDNEVKVAFDVPDSWELVAQMPFGGISQTPLPHSFENIEQKLIIRD